MWASPRFSTGSLRAGGLFDGQMHLLVDLSLKYVFGINDPSAGIYYGKFASVPVDFAI